MAKFSQRAQGNSWRILCDHYVGFRGVSLDYLPRITVFTELMLS